MEGNDANGSERRMPLAARWLLLLALSAALTGLLLAIHLPAAFLLGPMVAAIGLAVTVGPLEIPREAATICQAILGCMIVTMMPSSMVASILAHGAVFAVGTFSVIGVSALLGWLLAHSRIFPGSTAVWGLSPGAATVMIFLSAEYDADPRLVAFMQYMRVLLVAITASIVARFAGIDPVGAARSMAQQAAFHWENLGATVLLVAVGVGATRVVRIPSGALLVPLALGWLLQAQGWISIALPRWLLIPAFAVMGWIVGMRFDRPLLRHVLRLLPVLFAASAVLLTACAGIGMLLSRWAGIDPLTAYLATSPGGADTAAIIAASSRVDRSFVMSMQTVRLLVMLAISPSLSKFIARHLPATSPRPISRRIP